MLDAAQHSTILVLFKGGHSRQEICRLTGHARATVRKSLSIRTSPSQGGLAKSPSIRVRNKKMDKFRDFTKHQLDTRRISGVEMLDSLRHRGFDGSLASVQRFIRKYKKDKLKTRLEIAVPCGTSLLTDGHFWILRLMQGGISSIDLRVQLAGLLTDDDAAIIAEKAHEGSLSVRNRALTVAAHLKGFSLRSIAQFLLIDRVSAREYVKRFQDGGVKNLFNQARKLVKKEADPFYTDAVFKLLHSPPQSHGYNRTSWRMQDLKDTLTKNGVQIATANIRHIIHNAGFRFRKAKKVLTSNDPEYRNKLIAITQILQNLKLGEMKTVPAYQTAKGSLIATAALELSENQITHFYSEKKNTAEMIKLLDILLTKYAGQTCIYFSWDAASWHASKELYNRVEEVNSTEYRTIHQTPAVKLAPLPSCAQFLNVIESVFSGMARAIIHNSNYQSANECMAAIDRHFSERNQHFKDHPMRAGDKIWGKEVVHASFAESNNCKDPRFSNG